MSIDKKQFFKKTDFLKNKTPEIITKILILLLLIGLSYIVLYPFLFKILSAFMSQEDLYDPMVEMLPKQWTLERFGLILKNNDFIGGMLNTALYSLMVAVCSTFSAAFVGYGLAKFNFKGRGLIFALVVFTMLLPLQTIYLPLYSTFKFFDVFGILSLFGSKGISLTDTPFPMLILSLTSLGFRAGIFVILMRQYFLGVPKELTEAAYVDGSTVMNTFWNIILPMARSMLIVIFSLSFAWQWTDTFYSGILMSGTKLLSNVVILMNTTSLNSNEFYTTIVNANTASILAIVPLILFYCFLQKNIIQGIENSGIVG